MKSYQGPKLPIGAVTFESPDGVPANLMGEARVAALRAFYRQERRQLVAVADYNHSHSGKVLSWDDVRWDTAGQRVTSTYDPNWTDEERKAYDLGRDEAESDVTTSQNGETIEAYDQGRADGRAALGWED